MERPDLVSKILDYIRTTYNAEYIGYINVFQEGNMYRFVIGIPSYMVPTSAFLETDSDDVFLAYIYEELRTRNYMRLVIYKVIKTMNAEQEQRINEV